MYLQYVVNTRATRYCRCDC